MNRGFEKLLFAGISLLAVVVIANTWLAYRNTVRVYAAAERVAHGHEVSAAVEQVRLAVKDLETGERGYIITGNDRYLAPFASAAQHIHSDLAHLETLIGPDSEQLAELPRLRGFIDKKLDELRLTIAVRQERGIEDARAIVLNDRGRVAMDSIESVIGQMESHEQLAIESRTALYRESREVAISTGLAAGVLALIVVTAFLIGQQRYLRSQATAADELFEQKELFRTTLASIGDAVIATDLSGRVIFTNSVAESLTGWSAGESLGLPLETTFVIIDEATEERLENPARRALSSGAAPAAALHPILISRSGTQTPIDDRASVIRDAAGNANGAVLVFRDITERKRAERALIESDRRKDEFLAVLAHELRNPLAPMRSAVEIIALSNDDPAVMAQVREMMDRQLQQMVRLTDDLLDVSRITRDRLELRRLPVDLKTIVNSALETCATLIKQRKHTVTVELPDTALIVNADAARLSQVVYNLLGNAAKYTEPGGRIRIAAYFEGSMACITVTDNGIGIAAGMLDTVFEMFTQVDRSVERSHGGLGIGLTLAKRISELHGGTLVARSEGAGKGSEFTLCLPALAVEATAPLTSAGKDRLSGRTGSQNGRRIVVADDNRDAAEALSAMLRMIGHDVRVAFDAPSAFAAGDNFHPDVMLLDIGMPGESGYSLAERIRAEPWGAKVLLIALTGWGQPEDRRRSEDAGFDHHLVKPVELATLDELFGDVR